MIPSKEDEDHNESEGEDSEGIIQSFLLVLSTRIQFIVIPIRVMNVLRVCGTDASVWRRLSGLKSPQFLF
jgi:hypothetical protein